MTSLELTLNLPNRLAKDAAHAGLLSPKAIETLAPRRDPAPRRTRVSRRR